MVKNGLGTVANDVTVVSQLTGAIQPYYVTVDFWTPRRKLYSCNAEDV